MTITAGSPTPPYNFAKKPRLFGRGFWWGEMNSRRAYFDAAAKLASAASQFTTFQNAAM
jgi:hypothetical protein